MFLIAVLHGTDDRAQYSLPVDRNSLQADLIALRADGITWVHGQQTGNHQGIIRTGAG